MNLKEAMEKFKKGESAPEIQRSTGVSRDRIWKEARRLGIKRSTLFRKRKHTINDFYFSKIDTPIKAYWLGFIYADGCVLIDRHQRHYFTFHIHKKDADLLKRLCKDLETDYPVVFGKKDDVHLRISSRQLCNDLINLGVVPRKTYENIRIPNISYAMDFIRGVLDGDGCIFKDSISFVCQTRPFLEDIQSHINTIINREGLGSLCQCASGAWQLKWSGRKASAEVFAAIYRDAQVGSFLERKFNKVVDFTDYDLLRELHISKSKSAGDLPNLSQ